MAAAAGVDPERAAPASPLVPAEDGAPASPLALPEDDSLGLPLAPPREHPVFRYREHAGWSYALLAMFFLAPCAAARSLAHGDLALGFAAWIGLILLGYAFGRGRGADKCSTCNRELALEAERCAGCGGVVRGRIKNRDQRLAAEEALPGA